MYLLIIVLFSINQRPFWIFFLRYDKLIIDDNVYIYNDAEKRIERLPYSMSASSGLCLEDEVNTFIQIVTYAQ